MGAVVVSIHGQSIAAAWYNEPAYVNPGTEGLYVGLTPLTYTETLSNRFLGQYVCVDADGEPIPDDPYLCTQNRRKLRIGEDLPYIRFTKTSSGKLSSVSNSMPLMFGNRLRFINTRQSGSLEHLLRNYAVGDGYDITDNYRGYSFIYGTRDPKKTSEKYIWCGQFGDLGGDWVLWPDSISNGVGGSDVFIGNGGDYGQCSPTHSGYTVWDAAKWIPFSNGRSLYSIKTYHFSNSSVAAAEQIEVFYQNTLYGAVRWEAWKSTQQDSGGSECDGSTTMIIEGKTFYRSLCHEWTNLQPQTLPYHAYHTPLNTIFTTSPQLLKNSDFVAGTANWTASLTGPDGLTFSAATEASKNPYLAIQKSNTVVASVIQTVNGLGVDPYANPVLQGGVLLKGPAGEQGVIGIVLSSSKAPQQELKIRFNFKNSEWTAVRFHAESIHLTDRNVKMTFKFYPKGVGAYAMDEAFLAVLPKTLP